MRLWQKSMDNIDYITFSKTMELHLHPTPQQSERSNKILELVCKWPEN